MAGSRASSKIEEKARAGKSIQVKSKKTFLSTELVGDSEISDDEDGSKQTKQGAKFIKSREAYTKPTAAEPKSTGPAQPKKRRSPSPIKDVINDNGIVKDSQDYTTGEEENDSSSSSRNSSPSPTKLRPSAPAQASTEVKPLKPPLSNGTASSDPKTSRAHLEKRETSESASGEDSECGSAESSEDEGESDSASGDEISLQGPKGNGPTHAPGVKPARLPYEPPLGFSPASISSHPSSRISEILAPSNLVGKEIWHITVPTSVPVVAIKEVSAQSIKSGQSILSHNGADYGLVLQAGAEASNRALLLPSSQTNDYELSKSPIVNTLHLQRLVTIPNRAYQIVKLSNPTSKPPTHVKEVRQQPQGLKMRYHAFGASNDSDSDVSTEAESKTPQFRAPDTPVQPNKKRKLFDIDVDSVQVSPAKSKDVKARHGIHTEAKGSAMDIDSRVSRKSEGINPSVAAQPVDVSAKTVNGAESSTKRKRKKSEERHKDPDTRSGVQSILPMDLTREAETLVPEEVVSHDAGSRRIASGEEAEAEKARRKEERRKRKGSEKRSQMKAAETPSVTPARSIHQDSRSKIRNQSVPLPTPRHRSPQTSAGARPNGLGMPQTSSQNTPHSETKEEKAKRKEEKRKRKIASDFY